MSSRLRMSEYLLHFILVCCLLNYEGTFGYTIECKENEDCHISCEGTQSCMDAIINCPAQGDCNIDCHGLYACQDATVNATQSLGQIRINCDSSIDDCRNLKVYGSKLETANVSTHLSVSCNGVSRSCVNSEIHCPVNGDCAVLCNGDSSCQWSRVTGPNNGDLRIECNDERSCFDAIFNGANANKMDIKGCMATDSCLDLTLYCPSRTALAGPNCFLEGNTNLGTQMDGGHGLRIYAVNGWTDILIDYHGTVDQYSDDDYDDECVGHMFCGFAYDIACDIPFDRWECSNAYDYCNNNVEAEEHSGIYYHKPDRHISIAPTPQNNASESNALQTTAQHSHGIEGDYEESLHGIYTKFEDGPLGMIVVGAAGILLAICCAIIGGCRQSITCQSSACKGCQMEKTYRQKLKHMTVMAKKRNRSEAYIVSDGDDELSDLSDVHQDSVISHSNSSVPIEVKLND